MNDPITTDETTGGITNTDIQGQGTQSSQVFVNYNDPNIARFKIPLIIRDKYAELIKMILDTESMNDQERSYWFQIMPIMSTTQIDKLKQILITEKEQLTALDQKYEQEINQLNQKHVQEWKQFESKEQREKIQAKEQANEVEEAETEASLLQQLNDI